MDACEIDVTERMVESIREWGRMLAFTSELPLPLPLQVDDVPGGVKLAIVKFDDRLIEVGALNITVEEDVDAGKVDVVITRSWSEAQKGVDADTQLPGEQRILTDFSQEFNFLVGVESGRLGAKTAGGSKNPFAKGLSNVVSSISSFALPVMPLFGSARNVVPEDRTMPIRSGQGRSTPRMRTPTTSPTCERELTNPPDTCKKFKPSTESREISHGRSGGGAPIGRVRAIRAMVARRIGVGEHFLVRRLVLFLVALCYLAASLRFGISGEGCSAETASPPSTRCWRRCGRMEDSPAWWIGSGRYPRCCGLGIRRP